MWGKLCREVTVYGFVHDMDLKAEAPFDNPPKAESLSLGDSTGTAWIFCIPNRITLSFLPCWLYFVSLFLLLCRIWASYTFAGERWHTYLCQHVMSFFISMIHQREILSHSLWGYTMMVKVCSGFSIYPLCVQCNPRCCGMFLSGVLLSIISSGSDEQSSKVRCSNLDIELTHNRNA